MSDFLHPLLFTSLLFYPNLLSSSAPADSPFISALLFPRLLLSLSAFSPVFFPHPPSVHHSDAEVMIYRKRIAVKQRGVRQWAPLSHCKAQREPNTPGPLDHTVKDMRAPTAGRRWRLLNNTASVHTEPHVYLPCDDPELYSNPVSLTLDLWVTQ